jgi:hypothetical protein
MRDVNSISRRLILWNGNRPIWSIAITAIRRAQFEFLGAWLELTLGDIV